MIERAMSLQPVLTAAVEEQRLFTENVAIANGTATFIELWIPSGKGSRGAKTKTSEQSSIHKSTCLGRRTCRSVTVKAVTCADLILKYGPRRVDFLKVRRERHRRL